MCNLQIKFLFLLFYGVASLTIYCDFHELNLVTTDNVKTCEAVNISQLNNETDRDVEGCYGGKNKNIKCEWENGLIINQKPLKYFPGKLFNFFVSLSFIYIENCEITQISMNDLSPFRYNLRELSLKGNKIEKIEQNLLYKNSQLAYIDLSENKISFIDPKVFKGLNYMNSLCVTKRNVCINSTSVVHVLKYHQIEKFINGLNFTTEKPFVTTKLTTPLITQRPPAEFSEISKFSSLPSSEIPLKPLIEVFTYSTTPSSFVDHSKPSEEPSNISFYVIIGVSHIIVICITVSITVACLKKRDRKEKKNEIKLNDQNNNGYVDSGDYMEPLPPLTSESHKINSGNIFNNSYELEHEYAEIVEREVIYDHLNHLQAASRLKGYDVPVVDSK